MGGIASVVVVTPLGVSWKVMVDAASRWRVPFRPRRRRGKKN
jgi:hypothetical protein